MADTLNPFDLLGETDENAEPNIEQLAAAKAAAAKTAAKKEEPKAAAKAPVAAKAADAGRGTRGGRGDVRGRGAPPAGRGRIGTRPESGEVAENGYDAGAPAARGRGGRGEGRGRGGRGRGEGRGGGTYDSSRPRREFDRRDGTGRGYESQKRNGGGRGNWGAEDGSGGADAPAEEVPAAEEVEKVVVEGEEAPPAAAAAAEEAAPEEVTPPVEEVKEMSLDEYEALLAEKKAELNKARASRTIDMSEFANLKALNKDEEEEENPLEVSTSKEKKGPRAKERKEVLTVETGFKVAGEAPSFGGDRRGRGGRGGDRGGRGERGGRFGGRGGDFRGDRGGDRGGDRPYVPRGGRGGANINVEDTSAFPSLA